MSSRMILAAMLIIVVSVAGCNRGQENQQNSTKEILASDPVSKEQSFASTEPVAGSQTAAVGKKGDDFILPEAQTHRYTTEELADLTLEELRLARNERYARHRRRFKSDDLNTYFSGKTWYQATVEADSFDDQVLNQ